MLYAIIAGVIVLVGAATGVVLYVRKAAGNSAALKQADAAVSQDQQRIAQMETAADSARAERAKEFDAKVAAVRTAGDAASLLHATGHDPQTK